MIKHLVYLMLLAQSITGLGQKQIELSILEADSTWGKEIFNFPLGFAQDIKHKGFEEARFPKGWNDNENPMFWSYVFAWQIRLKKNLNMNALEVNLQQYFDGLMASRLGKIEHRIMPPSQVKLKVSSTNKSSFIGEIIVFEAFYTKKIMVLNVSIDQYYCPKQKQIIILFKFSPKPFKHEVWQKLNQIKVRANICNPRI